MAFLYEQKYAALLREGKNGMRAATTQKGASGGGVGDLGAMAPVANPVDDLQAYYAALQAAHANDDSEEDGTGEP